ncbi:MAG: hypothetical protein O2985_02955 [Proteobacteria bacterium]|nr:hypothetical protein [Pseudomonadota bacterium]
MRPGLISARALGATLGAAVMLAACGSVPQPFRPPEFSKRHNEFLLAPNSAGVVVRRIEGPVGWVGEAFAAAMAAALRDRGIVAGSKWSNQQSLQLIANGYQKLHGDRVPELVVTWSLTDRSGKVKETRETRTAPPDAFWETPTPAMFQDIAERNAEMVVSWIDPGREQRQPETMPTVAIAAIVDAPGDGAVSLGRAIGLALRAERIKVVGDGEADLMVHPRIAVTPAQANNETVRVTWILSLPDGAEVGQVAQENMIAAGTLKGRWGAIAVAIADGAADGIAELVRAYRDARAAGRINPAQ